VVSSLLRDHDEAAAEAGRLVRELLVATGSRGLLGATPLAETAG
jgi:hypothetical protein